MSDFIQQALTLSKQGDGGQPSWVAKLRSSGQAALKAHQFPGRKTEDWKYTSLRSLEKGDFLTGNLAEQPCSQELLDKLALIDNLGAKRLVFIDGRISSELSDSEFENGVSLIHFNDATDEQAERLSRKIGSITRSDRHLFSALSDALLIGGLYLHFEKNALCQQPIQIVYLSTEAELPLLTQQRLFIDVEANAQATVVEHFVSADSGDKHFVNGLTEIALDDNAQLFHYRLHMEQEATIHIGGVHANLARSSTLNSFHLGMGSEVKRIDVVINHCGEGAHCELNGVYLPRHKQLIDYHTTIEHAVPHCTTNEVFRGIVADQAKAVFNGRIHIHPQAQKTLAMLSNKNLLTSNKAEVDTKPELEIYADDVQCAHGATVAQLEAESLHYLMTRGISRKEAEVMLSFGFINEIIDKVKHDAISQYLRPIMAGLFARDPELMRHLV
jgi:Fe-S cluster assembly protein SufD